MESARQLVPRSGTFRVNTTELSGAVSVAVAGITDNLTRSREVVRDAVAHLLASFGGLRGVVENQQVLLSSIAGTLTSMGTTNITQAAGKMVNEFVDEVVRVSHESMRIIEQLIVTNEHVNAIVIRADRIDGLARETRFIALNARIETQRAGEAGRTFKVVADEVKRLAGASAELSTEIRREVDECHRSLFDTQKTAESLAAHDMSTAIESRTALIQTIERLDEVNRVVEQTLAQVSTSVSEAVRALQFEDIVAQLLNDSAKRVQHLGQLMLDAVAAVESGREDAASKLSMISQGIRELGRVGSVSQSSVDEGTIELF